MRCYQSFKEAILLAGAAVVFVALLSPSTAKAQETPVCDDARNHECDVEDFEGTIGSNFDFQLVWGPSPSGLGTAYHDELGEALEFGCYSTLITLKNPRQFVTFTFTGFKGHVNFVALDGNDDPIDEETIENDYAVTDQAQSVTLWGIQQGIEKVYMHHVDGSCNTLCNEPIIGEVRACNLVY